MAANRKPRKPHINRPLSVPKIIDAQMASGAHPQLAMQLYAALITLTERPTIESCNHMSDQLVRIAGGMSWTNKGRPILGRTDAHSIAIKSAIQCIESIVARDERTGVLTVTEQDSKTLRAAAGVLDGALGKIPATCYAKAGREIDEYLIGAAGLWARNHREAA